MLFSSTVSRIRQRLAALSGKSPSLPARRLRGLRLFLEPLEDRTVPSALSQTQLLQNYGQVRLNFEINQGQTDPQVNFLSHGPGYGLFLTPTEAVLSLQKPSTPVASTPSAFTGQPGALVVPPLGGLVLPPEGGTTNLVPDVFRMQLLGANATSPAIGLDQLPGISNYFIGNDPTQWHTNVPNFGQVEYQNIYPGVNLVYYGNQRQLEYDFDVAPGANPGVIRLRFQGQGSLTLDAQGNLVIHTAGGDLVEHAPVLYQEVAGVRQAVSGRYVLEGADQIGFTVGAYDVSEPLTIDPVLSYSTYLGGSGNDKGLGIAVDSAGNAYVTGSTASMNFPTTVGAFQTTLGSSTAASAFVTKLNASGTALVYSTYLGGIGFDNSGGGSGIAVDSAGNAYVTGHTSTTNFPTTPGAFQRVLNGPNNAFVTKLNATGTALVYSTYLGGNDNDFGYGIVMDSSGNAYVTGSSSSTNFPTTAAAFQTMLRNTLGPNAFVSKLNATGTALIYSTYLGGNGVVSGTGDVGYGIVVDSAGNAYVAGSTGSSNFPTTAGAFQTTQRSSLSDNAFVTKLNATGTALVYSTYLGGSAGDFGYGIALDSFGNAYVTGSTGSTNFPTTPGVFQTALAGSADAFVTKLNATGTALVYSTYLGGNNLDRAFAIAVDRSSNAYVAGATYSTNFPTTSGSFQTSLAGFFNAFVTKLNATGTALVYSTYFGGNAGDFGYGIALDNSGNAYVAGSTGSTNFPTTAGAFQRTLGGTSVTNAFVAKFSFADHFSVASPTSTTAGNAVNVTVTALDSNNNADSSYRGTVHFTSSDGQAVLPADYTFTAADAGRHTFSATLKTAGTQSITATDTSTSSITGSQMGITINPAAASSLLVSGFPSPVISGQAQNFSVKALDSYGNTVTGYTGKVHFTTRDGGAALPADYTFLGSDAGAHTFGATLETAGTQSLTATDTATAGITGTETNILVKPASFLVGGFPSPTTAGVAHAFTVTAENANGTTASGYTGTVSFTSNDAQAALPASYTFSGSDAGVHTFSATLKTAGTQSLTATDTTLASVNGSESSITVNAAALSKFAVTGFPSPTVAGVAHSFTVTVQDAYGNTITNYLGTVVFSSTDKHAILPAAYTFSSGDNGSHNFSATLETAGTQTISAKDKVKTTVAGSESVLVNSTAASHFKLSAPTSGTAGTAFSITVEALDPFGNIAPSYTGTVHFTSSDKQAVLPANYTFTGGDAGVHVFTNGVTLKTAGSQTVTATDTMTATINGKSSTIKVSAAAVNHLKVTAAASSTAGTAFSITVTAQDAFNNTVTGYTGTIHFTSSDMQALLPADYTFTATDKGVHVFSSGVILKTAGTQTVTATDKVTSTVSGSASIKVAAAKASTLRINAPSSVTHGVPFTFTVTILDAFGNVATGYTGTVHFSSSDGAANLPANYKFTASDAGIHTFSATLNTTGSQSLTATDTMTASITGTESGIQVA